MNKKLIEEAINTFSIDIVREVMDTVSFADTDSAYSIFEDMGMDEHMDCLSMIYFE